jgi:hypothetical protein
MRFPALIAPVLIAGCATITQGSSVTVTVDTLPPGASCEIRQGGDVISVVAPTPGSIVVPKSVDDLSVRCSRDGHLDAVGTLASEFQPMTFGNVIFGGVIGVAVDAASGAINRYPPLIRLTLQPEKFADLAARDRFFDGLRDDFEREAEETVGRIRSRCGAEQTECDRQLRAAEEARARTLAEIEQRRQAAAVAPGV